MDTVGVLMEATPKNQNYDNILEDLSNLKHVEHVHDLRLWYGCFINKFRVDCDIGWPFCIFRSLTINQSVLSVHLAIDNCYFVESPKILFEATELVKKKYQISTVTIQLEEYNDLDTMSCENCTSSLE